MVAQEIPNTGDPRPLMPISFFGPDRAVVTSGNDRGQTIEFVRDASGKVNWVRVVGARRGANDQLIGGEGVFEQPGELVWAGGPGRELGHAMLGQRAFDQTGMSEDE